MLRKQDQWHTVSFEQTHARRKTNVDPNNARCVVGEKWSHQGKLGTEVQCVCSALTEKSLFLTWMSSNIPSLSLSLEMVNFA